MKKNKFIKTNRAFTKIRKYGWLFTLLVAFGGLLLPKLGLLVILIMILLTITAFFSGRYWCGNFCPHGSLYDVILLPVSKNKKIPKLFKSKLFITLIFIMFVINFPRKIISVFSNNNDLLDKLGIIFVMTYFMVIIVGGILGLFINPRTWCQFCPMGSMQKLSYNLGKVTGVNKKINKKITISNIDKCLKCGKCAMVCPMQLTPYINFTDKNQFDDINCIKCSTCVVNCPAKILSLNSEKDSCNFTSSNNFIDNESNKCS